MAKGVKRAVADAGPVEGPWDLPEGWRWERLQDVAEVNPKTNFDLPPDAPVVFVPMAAVAEETGEIDLSQSRRAVDVAKGFTRFRQGDVLFAKITPCMENGKVAEVPTLESVVGAGSTEFHVVRSDRFVPGFLFRYLVQRSVRQDAEGNMSGSAGQLRVPTDYLRLLLVPVPPVETQRRIVARIDGLLAEIDEGQRALAAARNAAGMYSLAVENEAFGGALSPNSAGISAPEATTEELLAHVAATRKGRGKKEELRDLRTEELPPLPTGWSWARLEQLIHEGPTNGYSPKASQGAAGTPSLKLTATSGGVMRLDADCVKVLNETIEPGSPLFLQPGDVLFQRGNTRELVGIAAMFDGPADTFIYPDLMIRVRTPLALLARWIWRWANSPRGRAYMMDNAQGAAGSMPKISGETVRKMPIPIGPPGQMAEALELIDRAKAAVSLPDVDNSARLAQHLRQSILAAAFRGDLVA